jgi:hypothetical protein
MLCCNQASVADLAVINVSCHYIQGLFEEFMLWQARAGPSAPSFRVDNRAEIWRRRAGTEQMPWAEFQPKWFHLPGKCE